MVGTFAKCRRPLQPSSLLLWCCLSVGCEDIIGAEFGDFTSEHDAGTSDRSDGSSSAEASGDSGAIDDASTPPRDGGGLSCMPGDIHDIAGCANCGRYQQTCNLEGVWDPPFCQQQGACAPGTTEHRSCEGDGTMTATCTASCTWMLEACDHTTCVANEVDQQTCGLCGTQSRNCQAGDGGWKWTPFSACMDTKDCAPNDVDRERCGKCGTHARHCDIRCMWGAWDVCQNEGECVPGDTQERGCLLNLLRQLRTCSDQCVWGDWVGLCL